MTGPHRGSFFAIDRRIWSKLCDSGINAAVAYLVMACGTGRDNRITSWSAQALHKYCGITWERGKAVIDGLIHDGFVRRAADHSPAKPRYELLPSCTPDEVENDGDPIIWLPNTIVTGTEKGETPPVHRLRSAGSILAMRLFVKMYHAQNLRDDGGISPRIIRSSYERSCIGEQGIFTVWGFRSTQRQIFWSGPFAAHEASANVAGEHPVSASIGLLERMGLLTFIPHIFENDSPEAEIHHPYGIGAKGEESIETEIGEAAEAAARAMCPEWMISNAEDDGFEHFCPVSRTMPNIEMIGVARLRYRSHTSRTAAWYDQLQHTGGKWVEEYQDLEARARTSRAAKRA
jgi:hypothetical protein